MLDSQFFYHATEDPIIMMNQLKSIYNSQFKSLHSHPIHTCLATIASNEVMFSQACVSRSVLREQSVPQQAFGCVWPGGYTPPPHFNVHPPSKPQTVTEVGGTLPTGMHSCWIKRLGLLLAVLVGSCLGVWYDGTDKGFTSVPTDIPANASTVWLNHNAISTVETDAFSNIPECYSIILDYNVISSIKPGAFNGLGDLHVLSIEYNKLRVITGDIWAGLSSLDSLYLSVNEIETVGSRAFEPLTKLRQLSIKVNKIHKIQPETWKGLDSLVE